jgi:anti-anti-sigma factor
MQIDRERGIAIIRPSGWLLGGKETDELTFAARELLESGNRCLVVDLGGVDALASLGLGALIDLFVSYKKRGGDLKFCSLRPKIRTVFEHIMSTPWVHPIPIPIYPDRVAAVASFAPGHCPEW